MNGKGSSPRSCFSKEYKNNYDEIFRKKSKKKEYKDLLDPSKPLPPFNPLDHEQTK